MDCRSNIDNRTLEPIYDEISEIAFIKKYDNIFDNEKYFQFSDANIMMQEVNEKYHKLIFELDKSNPTYLARKCYSESKREEDLNSIKAMEEKKTLWWKKKIEDNIEDKVPQVSKSQKTKILVDFCTEKSVSSKSFALKEKQQV